MGNSQTSRCSQPLTNQAEYRYERVDGCCFEFTPCEDGNWSHWGFGDGSPAVPSPAGESVTHCFPCSGTAFVVTRSVTWQGTPYSFGQTVYTDCSFITASFEYDVIAFSGCPDPFVGCHDCESVTLQFTDTSFSDNQIVSWNWQLRINGSIHSTSSLQNPVFTISDWEWNTGNFIDVTLTVTDECNDRHSIREEIRGTC